MNELLLRRVTRRLENLPDAQGYQILDYIEFLESRYGTGVRRSTPAERLSDAVEDTMRVVRLPGAAIRGTMNAVDSASRLMDRLAQAGRAAVDELGRTLSEEGAPEIPEGPEPPQRGGAADPGPMEGGPGRSA